MGEVISDGLLEAWDHEIGKDTVVDGPIARRLLDEVKRLNAKLWSQSRLRAIYAHLLGEEVEAEYAALLVRLDQLDDLEKEAKKRAAERAERDEALPDAVRQWRHMSVADATSVLTELRGTVDKPAVMWSSHTRASLCAILEYVRAAAILEVTPDLAAWRSLEPGRAERIIGAVRKGLTHIPTAFTCLAADALTALRQAAP